MQPPTVVVIRLTRIKSAFKEWALHTNRFHKVMTLQIPSAKIMIGRCSHSHRVSMAFGYDSRENVSVFEREGKWNHSQDCSNQ